MVMPNSMDREADGASGDPAAVEVPHGLAGDPRVAPADRRPAMPASLVVGEAPGAAGTAGADVDLVDREAEAASGGGAGPAAGPCAAAGEGAARKAAAGDAA